MRLYAHYRVLLVAAALLGCAPAAPPPDAPPPPPASAAPPATPASASASASASAPAEPSASASAAASAPPEPPADPLVAVADETLRVSERSQCTWLVGSWQRFLGTFPQPFQIRDPADPSAQKRDPAGYEGSIAQRYGLLADHAAGLRITDKRLKELQQRGVSLAREVAHDTDGADAKRLTAMAAKEKAFIDDLNRYCIKFDIGSAEAAARVIKACKGGDAPMCGLAANVADSRAEALALANRGCPKGDGLSCLMVASIENEVRPGGPLTPAADKALRKVCEMGQADACAVLGMAYDKGLVAGVTAKPASARRELDRACGAGSDIACDITAKLPFTGKRQELLLRACRAGHTLACERLSAERR